MPIWWKLGLVILTTTIPYLEKDDWFWFSSRSSRDGVTRLFHRVLDFVALPNATLMASLLIACSCLGKLASLLSMSTRELAWLDTVPISNVSSICSAWCRRGTVEATQHPFSSIPVGTRREKKIKITTKKEKGIRKLWTLEDYKWWNSSPFKNMRPAWKITDENSPNSFCSIFQPSASSFDPPCGATHRKPVFPRIGKKVLWCRWLCRSHATNISHVQVKIYLVFWFTIYSITVNIFFKTRASYLKGAGKITPRLSTIIWRHM